MSAYLIEKIIRKVASKKEFVFLLIAIVVFSFVSYVTFFQSDPEEFEISEYSKMFENDYSGHNNCIDDSNSSIKNLVSEDQIKEMKYYEELVEEKSYSERENPFIKSF